MKRLIFPLFIFIFTFAAHAQWDAKEVAEKMTELSTFHILGADEQPNANVALLNQIGDDNSIVAIQQKLGITSNQILSIQQNDNNQGYIEQTGEDHKTVLYQNGFGNDANLWSVGSKTITLVNQSGDNNSINSYISNPGFSVKAAYLIQYGNNNQINFALPENRGYTANYFPEGAYIKQTGYDLGVTAIFDDYSPIYIEQQSGPGGGMKVVAANSAFSFPMKKY